MQVTVYSPPEDCLNCGRVKRRLDKEGIPYSAFVATDEQVDTWRAEKLLAFPVVVVDLGDEASWTFGGYRIDDLVRVKKLHREALAAAA